MTDRDRLKELLEKSEGAIYWNGADKNFIEKIADYLIANGVTVNEWRPASEPPKEDGSYLTFRKGIGKQVCRYANDLFKVHSVDFAYYDKGGIAGWYIKENGYYRIDDVTHWMPLPRLRRR